MARARLVDALSLPTYDLGPEHPFAPARQRPLFDLLHRHQLVTEDELLAPASADRAALETAHRSDYVDALIALSVDDPTDDWLRRAPVFGMNNGDNPVRPHQHDAAAAAAGGSLELARSIAAGTLQRGFNSTGGLHHAMPGSASGFCLYNDLVVAIRAAQAAGCARVAYVDYDVHHGDGVEYAFAADPNVLTISFHETPDARWPYTGRVEDVGQGDACGTIVNVPFASGTGDASWQEVVGDVVRTAIARFAPDFLVTQHGCDPHHEDPLADLQLTTASFEFAAELSRDVATDHVGGGRWLATGGGGYQPYRVLPRAWAIVWAAVSDRTLPEHVDPAWLEAWQGHSRAPLADRFIDEPHANPREGAAAEINARTLDALRRAHGW